MGASSSKASRTRASSGRPAGYLPSTGLLSDVDPDEAGRHGHRLSVLERERERAVAVHRFPRSLVAEAFVVDVDRAARVQVVVVDVRAMTVADVEQLLARVDDDQHLDSQRLLQA